MRGLLNVLLALALVLAGCTDGTDDDNDGLEDSLETGGWASQIVEFMDRRVEVKFASDPSKVDTDGDGLTDQQEFFMRTNPAARDTDDDGLTDCQETRHTNATQCETPGFDSETEGDGGYRTDPRKADSDPGASFYKLAQPWTDETGGGRPQWGDGISDGDEVNGYWIDLGDRRTFVRTDPRSTDTDGDGADDGQERFTHGSNPTLIDTDGDECRDSLDPWPARDPMVGPGLQELELDDGGEVRITIQFWGNVTTIPDEARHLGPGETWDLRDQGLEVRGSTYCSIHISSGWTEAKLIVSESGAARHLDVTGDQLSEGSLFWNPYQGIFAASPEGPELQTPIRLSGDDGRLTLAAYVR